jgi:hypothetical protein
VPTVDAAVAHVEFRRSSDRRNESGFPSGEELPAAAADDCSATTGMEGLAPAGSNRMSIELVARKTKNGDAMLAIP